MRDSKNRSESDITVSCVPDLLGNGIKKKCDACDINSGKITVDEYLNNLKNGDKIFLCEEHFIELHDFAKESEGGDTKSTA